MKSELVCFSSVFKFSKIHWKTWTIFKVNNQKLKRMFYFKTVFLLSLHHGERRRQQCHPFPVLEFFVSYCAGVIITLAFNMNRSGQDTPLADIENLGRKGNKSMWGSSRTIPGGSGHQGATEKVAHTLRTLAASLDEGDNMAFVFIDLTNGFNTITRASFLAEVSRLVPQMLPWVNWTDGASPLLRMRTGLTIRSETGVKQRDSRCCWRRLIIPSIWLVGISSAPPSKYQSWSAGSPSRLQLANSGSNLFTTVWRPSEKSSGPRVQEIGLQLNPGRCRIWSTCTIATNNEAGHKMQQHMWDDGIVFLGTPLGGVAPTPPPKAARALLEKSQSCLKKLLDALVRLNSPHEAFLMLRSSCGYARINHLQGPASLYTLDSGRRHSQETWKPVWRVSCGPRSPSHTGGWQHGQSPQEDWEYSTHPQNICLPSSQVQVTFGLASGTGRWASARPHWVCGTLFLRWQPSSGYRRFRQCGGSAAPSSLHPTKSRTRPPNRAGGEQSCAQKTNINQSRLRQQGASFDLTPTTWHTQGRGYIRQVMG